MEPIHLKAGKKIFFASDHHLGAPSNRESLPREKKFVSWLDSIKKEAGGLFLMGDLFDFWYEYKTVVPKGFTRILGKLAEFTDSGIPVYYFVGNHDLWMNGYFEEELNVPVFHRPQSLVINDTNFLIGHGDGLGPGDKGFKRMKKVFTNPVAKWFFRWLHPDLGVRFAKYLSVNNKIISGEADAKFLGEDNEWLVQYCKRKLEKNHYDYFVFGHRHLPMEIDLNEHSTYINLGDWIQYFTYAVFDGKQLKLKNLNQ